MIRTLLLACLCASSLRAQAPFEEARSYYDQGDFQKALSTYQSIEGQSAALDYNIGNTLMRLNETAHAIAYYRRALWQTPSDPDIRANIEKSKEKTGAILPPLPFSRKLSGFFDARAWQISLLVSCWLTAGLGIARIKFPGIRNLFTWIFPLLGMVICMTAAGVWISRPSAYFQEGVLKGKEVTALFAPLPDATERFSLPGGSVVKVVEKNRNWMRITAGEESGWVPADRLWMLKDL